jgi:hypothetical protein
MPISSISTPYISLLPLLQSTNHISLGLKFLLTLAIELITAWALMMDWVVQITMMMVTMIRTKLELPDYYSARQLNLMNLLEPKI